MLLNKLIWQLVACFVTLDMVFAYPQERYSSTKQINSQSQRLNAETEADLEMSSPGHKLQHLYRYERTLHRLRRALEELDFEEAGADDMELAEINVFRPLFRYRAEVARQVKNPRQQQFG